MAAPRAAPASPSLPDPQGSQLEVSFRRLLESCLKHLQALDAAAPAAAAAAAAAGAAAAATATATATATCSEGGGAAVVAANDSSGATTTATATAASTASITATTTATATTSGAGADSSDTAARVLKMRHYVDTLRELLSDLRTQQELLGLDAATLDLYDTHVKAVAAAVPKVQLPPYCQNLITASAVAPGGGGNASGGSNRPAPNLSYFTPPPARPGVTPAGGSRTEGRTSGAAAAGLGSAAAERLREAEAAQALLTDELAGLSAALRSNAVGLAGAVADRGRLLEATEGALTDSLAATKRNVAAAGEQVKRSGGTLCFTCMVMLLVGLAFTAMLLYIKFTHIAGYRAVDTAATASSSFASGGGGAEGWLGSGGSDGGDLYGGGGSDGVSEQLYHGGAEPRHDPGEL